MDLLELHNLSVSFGSLRAVNGVSFEVRKGEIVGLIGPNGAGKTTIFNTITGYCRAQSGEVRFAGQSILGSPPHQIAARGVVRTFQNIELFGEMSALENVLTGMHLRVQPTVLGAALRLPGARAAERSAREEALRLLTLVGAEALAGQRASALSFGQQRLLELARALAVRPSLLLLDEPASGLAADETAALDTLLSRLREREGITILLVEHVIELVMGLCDRVIVLDHGEMIGEGTPDEVRADPRVIKAYLGTEAAAC
jgi:branched-chain amino acid transport system ATP-binding protein